MTYNDDTGYTDHTALRNLSEAGVPNDRDRDQLLGMVRHAAEGTLSRRGFVALAAAIGAGQLVASQLGPMRRAFGAAGPTTSRPPVPGGAAGAGNIVTIFLGGGNDGLNTLVPFGDAEYHRLRPSIKLMPNEVLSLGTDVPLGLHPSLVTTQAKYLQGKVALITGVGYNAPDLSHFNSQDHWESGWGAPGSAILPIQTGWLGRWLDTVGAGPFGAISFRADDRTPVGVGAIPIRLRPWDSDLTGAPTTDAMELLAQDAFRGLTGPTGLGSYANSLGTVLGSALSAGGIVGPALKNIPSGTSYIGRQMIMAARLLNAGIGTRVITTSHGGFDNHNEQAIRGQNGNPFGWHGKLLSDLDIALNLLFTTLTPAALANTTVLVYSEFGRRVEENGSYGTDHGTSGVAMVMGDGVNGGIFGEQPSLLDLDSNANLRMNIDFRSVQATLLSRFLGADDSAIIGASHQRLLLSAADAAAVSTTTTSTSTSSTSSSSSTSTSTSTSTSPATSTIASTVSPTTEQTTTSATTVVPTTEPPTTVVTTSASTVAPSTTPTTVSTTAPTTTASSTLAPTTGATTVATTQPPTTTAVPTTLTPPSTSAATTVATTQPGTTAAASTTLSSSTTSSTTSTTLARTTTTVPSFPPPVVVNPGPGPKTPSDPDPVTIVRLPPAPAVTSEPVPPTVGFDKPVETETTTTQPATGRTTPSTPSTTAAPATVAGSRPITTLPKQLALKPRVATKARTRARAKVTSTTKKRAGTAANQVTTPIRKK